MAFWNWKDFSGGISDDSFLGRTGEFYDCENVNIQDNVRYITGKYAIGLPSELGSSLGEEVHAVQDGIYPAYSTENYDYIGGADATPETGGESYLIEQIGSQTLPVTYFFQNGSIHQITYNGSIFPYDTSITTNVPSGIPTATCIGAGRIYFAVSNAIYVLVTNGTNPTSAPSTVNATAGNNAIPFGYTIKFMYLYNDILNVVATSNSSTHIYQLTEDTTDVWVIRYTHKISGVIAIGATGENNNVFWFSSKALYQTNGTESQKIKVVGNYQGRITFSTNSIITIRDSIIYIADGTTVWEYGAIKPGYNSVLTKQIKRISVTAMDGDKIVYYGSGKVYTDRLSNQDTLYDNAEVTSLPYEAGEFNQPKTNTALRVGYILPKYSTYSSTSTLANITVGLITDEMEANGETTPVVIRTLSTPITGIANRYEDISSEEINNALADVDYSPDFQYAKIVVGLNGGDPSVVTGFGTAFFRKMPKLLGINLVHNEILKGIPN